MRPQVFIVEGHHDASRLKEVLGDIQVIVTNGSEVNQETLDLIQTLDLTHDLIVFTDPDYAGERIRKKITKDLNHVYHAFLTQDQAVSKNRKKIGVEHASKEDITDALKHIQLAKTENSSDVNRQFLYSIGLIGQKDSQLKRDVLSKTLNLGHVNGKTLLKRLWLFNISQQSIREVMNESST